MEKNYDVLIVGGGPGGYSAALYCARAGLKTAVLEKLTAGGQMALTQWIDNYPGFPQGIEGIALGKQMRRCAERFGAQTVSAEVSALSLAGHIKTVTADSDVYRAPAVIIATGAQPRLLGLPLEKELTGRGVHYCAACDGMFYRGKTVVVVGGGNSAVEDALELSRICRQVFLVHRRDTLRAAKVYHSALENARNITVLWNSQVTGLQGEQSLRAVQISNSMTGETFTVPCGALFVSIGRTPSTDLVKDALTLDRSGYIIADETTRTNLSGVFAVGDVRTKTVRQVVTAAADGAAAAHYVQEYLAEKKN